MSTNYHIVLDVTMSSKAEKREQEKRAKYKAEQEKRAKYKAEQDKFLKEIAKVQAQLRGIKTELDKLPLDEKRKKKLKDDQKEAQKELDRAKGQLDKYKAKLERLPPEQPIPMDQLSPSTEHDVQIGMPGASSQPQTHSQSSQPQSHSQSGQPQLQPSQPSLPLSQQYYDGGQIMPPPGAHQYTAVPPIAPSQPCSQPTLSPHMIPASPSPYPPTMQTMHLSEVIYIAHTWNFTYSFTAYNVNKVVTRLYQDCHMVVITLLTL